jgi:hypothetical protein
VKASDPPRHCAPVYWHGRKPQVLDWENPPPELMGQGTVIQGMWRGLIPQCPASTARPRCVIEREGGTEALAAFAGKQRPGDCPIAGGITDGRTAVVNGGTKRSARYRQIAASNVAMDPYRRAAPLRGKRGLPRCRRGSRVDAGTKC